MSSSPECDSDWQLLQWSPSASYCSRNAFTVIGRTLCGAAVRRCVSVTSSVVFQLPIPSSVTRTTWWDNAHPVCKPLPNVRPLMMPASDTFSSAPPLPFVKLSCADAGVVRKLRDEFLNMSRPTYNGRLDAMHMHILEQKTLSTAGWFKNVPGSALVPVTRDSKPSDPFVMAPSVVLSVDIEVQVPDDGSFPDAIDNPIVCIAAAVGNAFAKEDDPVSLTLFVHGQTSADLMGPFNDASIDFNPGAAHVVCCSSEEDVINQFYHWTSAQIDPDIITGWNGESRRHWPLMAATGRHWPPLAATGR
jgi:hypothetical protein